MPLVFKRRSNGYESSTPMLVRLVALSSEIQLQQELERGSERAERREEKESKKGERGRATRREREEANQISGAAALLVQDKNKKTLQQHNKRNSSSPSSPSSPSRSQFKLNHPDAKARASSTLIIHKHHSFSVQDFHLDSDHHCSQLPKTMSISSQGLSSGQQDGNNLETVAPDQQTTTCSDQNADSGKFKAVASMFAKKVISRSSPLVGNLYPTNTTSSSTLNLMGQLKAWTLDRKLKGKLRRLSSRSGLNSNNNQIKVDSVVNCVDDKDSIDCCSVQSKNSGEDSCFDESTSTTSNRSTPSPGTPGIPCPQSSEPPSSEAPQAASTMSLSPSSSTGSEADSQYNSDYGERDDLQKAIDCLTADQLARVNLLAVTLDKDDQGELGIYVTGKMDSDGSIGYVIADFEADGPAQRNGRLNKGDEVLMVNGNGLRGLNLDDALQFLRSRETSLRLIVARQCQVSVSSKNESLSVCSNSESLQSMSHSHSSLNATETVTTKPQIGALNTSLNNQRRRSQASPAPCEQQQAAAQPCLSQSVAGQRIRRASSSLEAEYEKDETISIASNSTNSSALMESGLFTVPRRPKSSARILLQTLTFYKGPGCRGLGFSIVGGADAENSCSNNVYIKTIYPNGQAAERLDELKQGDELLAVNGISTKGLTHSEVIALFKTVKCGEVIIQTSRKLSSIRKAFNRSNHKSCSTLDLLK